MRLGARIIEMRYSVVETLIGAAVLLLAFGFLVFAGGFWDRASGENYHLRASFRSVEGISAGTEVRLGGVAIGNLQSIKLNPETFFAETTLAIETRIQLPEDSSVKIASEGLLGGHFVEITPGGSEFLLQDGDEIVNTQGAVSLTNLLLKFGLERE